MPERIPYEPKITPGIDVDARKKSRGKILGGGNPVEGESTPPAFMDATDREIRRRLQGRTEHEETFTAFQGRVDSIITTKLPRKTRKDELNAIVVALERMKTDAEKVDKHFGEEKPAATYLQKKIELALEELTKLSLWPE